MTTIALNHEKIEKHPEKISKIKSFIDKYNWQEINYLSEIEDWKKIEEKESIALNVFHVKKEKNILLMFQNITQRVENYLYFLWFPTEKDCILLQ